MLVPEVDFSSLTWPFLAQGRFEITTAPLDQLAGAIDGDTDVVAFSAVQSSDGTVADLDGLAGAAAAHGAFSMVDATHAVGWLPFDASRFDAVACAAYKWLMSLRGTAFLAVSERALEQTPPLAANWFAAGDRFGHYYDPELRLARRTQGGSTSPPPGSRGSLPSRRSPCCVRSASKPSTTTTSRSPTASAQASASSGGNSAIVSADLPGAEERLLQAGIRTAVRGGSLRASFHLYNTEDDVDAALSALLD